MQTPFFARRSIALGAALALVTVVLIGVVVWRTRPQTPVDAAPATAAPSGEAALTDPKLVHEQWVIALRDGNRPAALRLYAPGELHDPAVDNQLQRMDSKLHSPASTLGQLVRVTPEAPKVDGAQARGTSRWEFGNGSMLCFETKLNRDDTGAWYVTDYGSVPCTSVTLP